MGAGPRPGVTQPPPSRPTTPLRPSSRSSVRSACFGQHGFSHSHGAEGASQPAIVALQSQFSELADSISDLEANFMHLQLMHESLSRFNENFASFLYGLNMNAFSVDFPEGPIPLSFKRAKERQAAGYAGAPGQHGAQDADVESTFLTTDTSFVDHPQPQQEPAAQSQSSSARGRAQSRPARGAARGRGTVPSSRGTRTTSNSRGTTTTTTRRVTRRVQ